MPLPENFELTFLIKEPSRKSPDEMDYMIYGELGMVQVKDAPTETKEEVEPIDPQKAYLKELGQYLIEASRAKTIASKQNTIGRVPVS